MNLFKESMHWKPKKLFVLKKSASIPPDYILGISSIWFFISKAIAKKDLFTDLTNTPPKRYGNIAPRTTPRKIDGEFREI